MDSIYDLESLFVEHQHDYLPISPPSMEVFTQDYGLVVPVRIENLPRMFAKKMVGELNPDGIPLYRITVYEDYATRETVFLNADGSEIYRLEPEPGYDPYAWQKSTFLLSSTESLDPWAQWVFDPAHIAADFTLVPQVFYADYVLAEEQRRLDEAAAMPMMAMASSESSSNMVVGFSMESNGVVSLDIALPEDFGNHAEIFSTYNLIYVPWSVAANRLSCTGGTHLVWTAPTVPYADAGFFIVSDADQDGDGDGYSDLRERHVSHTDPSTFNLVDVDQDGMHDWYEITLFGGTNQTALQDFDGDGLANGFEMVILPGYLDLIPPAVWLRSDPSECDTDFDGMDDGFEMAHAFLDPKNPADALEDEDHDQLNNAGEVLYQTDILDWDTDHDTFSDGIEVAWGTDPKEWNSIYDDVDGDGLNLAEEYQYGGDPAMADTDGDGVSDGAEVAQGGNPASAADGGQAPPAEDVVELTLTVGDHSGSDSEVYDMSMAGERSIRLHSGGYGNLATKSFKFLRGNTYAVTLRHIGTDPAFLQQYGEPDYDYTLTVEPTGSASPQAAMEEGAGEDWVPGSAGAPPSSPVVTSFGTTLSLPGGIGIEDPDGILGLHGESSYFFAEGKQALIHIAKAEILDAAMQPASALKIAKWTDAFSPDGTPLVNFIDDDPDCFHVRVVDGSRKGQGTLDALVSTDSADAAYDDDPTPIELLEEPAGSGIFVSQAQLLVVDAADDACTYYYNGVPDDQRNDRLHRVVLGGKVKVQYQTAGGTLLDAREASVACDGTVHLTPIILRDEAGGIPARTVAEVEAELAIARERYAQVGIDLTWSAPAIHDPPTGVDLQDSDGLLVRSSSSATVLAQEAKTLIDQLGTTGNVADIHVFFANMTSRGVNDPVLGSAIADDYYDESEDPYLYNIFMGDSQVSFSLGYAIAHELGHLLTDAYHADESWRLMYGYASVEGYDGNTSKRLVSDEEQSMKGDSHVQ